MNNFGRNNLRNNLRKPAISGELQNVFSMLLIIVFVIFVVYLIYSYVSKSSQINNESPVLINGELDAFVKRDPVKLPVVKNGLSHSVSTWIYVKDFSYNFGTVKSILRKGNPTDDEDDTAPHIYSPGLFIAPETNTLMVKTSTTMEGGSPESCDIQNIPLMKWVHIAYVLSNRSVDVYVNGKLERSQALQGIPIIGQDSMYITYGESNPGFYGKIGKTQYFTKALNPAEISAMYNEGPLGNTLYKLKLFDEGSFLSLKPDAAISEKSASSTTTTSSTSV